MFNDLDFWTNQMPLSRKLLETSRSFAISLEAAIRMAMWLHFRGTGRRLRVPQAKNMMQNRSDLLAMPWLSSRNQTSHRR